MGTITGIGVRRCLVAGAVITLAACYGPRDPQTAEEKTRRGDELMRKMSDTLAAAQGLSFSVAESHERVLRNGQKQPYSLKREVVVRRPDRLWSHATGSDNRDIKVSYDGSEITVVGAGQKVYAKIKGAPTLDQTLDLIDQRYDLRVAVADFLYSSPYDSFAGSDAQGGWAAKAVVEGRQCEEVVYATKTVDFKLAVSSAEPVLPCRLQITYKSEPGQPVSTLVFSNWNLKAQPADSQFVANVPQGYELIPVVERIPKDDLKKDAAKAMGAAAKK